MADRNRTLLSWLMMPAGLPHSPQEYFSRLPVIETPRLILRRMTLKDAPDLFAYSQDPEVARHVLWTAHRSIWETKAYIRYVLQQYRLGEPSSWCIVEKETNRAVGTIGFMSFSAENSTVEVGYSLARSHWNRGLMTEALEAVLNEAFTVLRLHRVEAQHFSANPSSGRVMEKCGMTHEGHLRQRIWNKGEFQDVEMWAILRRDWQKRHPMP
ncbi:MAG: GNAT family N-acetyltransferase [Clostridiales bacterium]|nr:GNAT family N-acetyltransferase [Clostridiales bacterium]